MPTTDDLYITMMCLIGFSFEYIKNTFNILIGNLQEINLNDVFTKVFIFIMWLKNCVEVNAKYMYDTYPIVRKNTDMVCYAFDYSKAHLNGYRIEPFSNTWISLSFLEKSNPEIFVGDKYVYSEQYYLFNSNTSLSIDDLHKQCLNHVTEIAKSSCNASIFETMITMKVSDKYLCNSFFHNENNTTPVYILSKNKGQNYFLSVEYTHPKMLSGIVLDLPTNIYNPSSNILTPAFIKRYLEYQELPYVFDMRYTLKILDTNINIFTMKSNQYIKLTDNSYEVVTIEPIYNDESDTEEENEEMEYNTDEDANHADDEKGDSDDDNFPKCENKEGIDLQDGVDSNKVPNMQETESTALEIEDTLECEPQTTMIE